MMDIIPFLKVNSDYYVLITNEVKECMELDISLFFNKSMLDFPSENNKVKKHIVNEILLFTNIKVNSDYYIYKDTKTIILYKKKNIIESLFQENQDFEYYLGLDKINNFRLKNKSYLLENLFNERKNHIVECLDILAKYCFCNEYSLWLYNGITKVMTREAASKHEGQDYVEKGGNTTLFDFIESGLQYDIRKPKKEYANKVGFGKMKTLNRILIPLDNNGNEEYCGVLNFYSLLENYNIKDETIKFIQSYLKTRMIEKRESIHLALERFEKQLTSSYDLTDNQPFLDDVVEKIAKEFKFETCSIFVTNNNILKLISTHNAEYSGSPRFPVEYPLDGDGLSIKTIKENRIVFSYDLKNDKRNSHFFDEPKTLRSTNWIGIPLKWNDQVKGILRVSNKYCLDENGNRKIKSLSYEDFIYLKAACGSISSILRIIELIQKHVSEISELEQKTTELEQKTTELENFSRIFLHEIRTPISKFSLSPISIKKILNRGTVDAITLAIVEKRLDDITVLGDRLSFITHVYYYDQMVLPQKIEKVNVLSDIIYPIVNITREYVKTKWKIDIVHDGDSLRGYLVLGDKRLLNIVLNTLVDNAAKYSTEEKVPIKIYGKRDIVNNMFKIYVSNYGFPIDDNEVDEIFIDKKRGRFVVENKLEGTGIGLSLAKKIMINSNGDLKLISNKNPITFEITIPTF